MIKFKVNTLIALGNVTGTLTSPVVDLRFNYGYAVQASFTGTPSGAVVVEGSNDQLVWTQVSSDTISGTTSIGREKDACYYPFIRVSKAAGGTGTMTVTICIKGA